LEIVGHEFLQRGGAPKKKKPKQNKTKQKQKGFLLNFKIQKNC
jgi:hypothetical protein